MASEGPNSPDVGEDEAGIGSVVWTAPTDVVSSNDVRANAIVGVTRWLKATDYDFVIPAGATIDGIVVEIEKAGGGTGVVRDNAVRIVKGGTIGSTDKSTADDWLAGDSYITYGTSTDLWGESWTADDINGTGFGSAISAKLQSGVSATALVDHIRITVYYTEGPPITTSPPT